MTDHDKLIFKIRNSGSFYMLFRLEEDFNRVGLSLQRTVSDNMILCRVEDGRPVTDKPFDDYLFVAPLSENAGRVGTDTMQGIVDFVLNNSGGPCELSDAPRIWMNGFKQYGKFITLAEDINKLSDLVSDDP